MLAMSDDDSRKSSSPQRSKLAISSSGNENKHAAKDKNPKESNSVKPNMVYIVSNEIKYVIQINKNFKNLYYFFIMYI